jgi:hypothetical protein
MGKGAPPLLRLTPPVAPPLERAEDEEKEGRWPTGTAKGGGRPGQPACVAPTTSSLCAAAALSLAATAQGKKHGGEEACRRPCCGKEEHHANRCHDTVLRLRPSRTARRPSCNLFFPSPSSCSMVCQAHKVPCQPGAASRQERHHRDFNLTTSCWCSPPKEPCTPSTRRRHVRRPCRPELLRSYTKRRPDGYPIHTGAALQPPLQGMGTLALVFLGSACNLFERMVEPARQAPR